MLPAAAWLRIGFVLALIALLIALGCWQLERAEQKRALRAAFERQLEAAPLDLALHKAEPLINHAWRRVRGTGRYEPPILLLDNRVREGRVGYEVLTAFRLDDGARILVDRGWMAAPPRRTDIPDLGLPAQVTSLHGRLAPAPTTGIILGDAAQPERLGPDLWRLQHIDFATLDATFAPGFLPMLVYLDEAEPGGYDRDFALPAVDDGKHTAYAVQWFAMAGAVAILLGISLHRRRHGQITTGSSDPR
ncbi:MAG TPA: SURF1 family protein [Gammaproteobacteria bacterium]|nr:SURF1 family protein [Gammaproteobacteria bacterium]